MRIRQSIVPVGEYAVSAEPAEELVTVVGSCVAVTLWDREAGAGGLVHIVLPGRRGGMRENENHAFYADTGVALLVSEMLKISARKENLVAGVVGGAAVNSEFGENSIGRRNAEAAIAVLRKNGIVPETVDVGGTGARKVTLDIGGGEVRVRKTAAAEPVSRPGRGRTLSGHSDPGLSGAVGERSPGKIEAPMSDGRLVGVCEVDGAGGESGRKREGSGPHGESAGKREPPGAAGDSGGKREAFGGHEKSLEKRKASGDNGEATGGCEAPRLEGDLIGRLEQLVPDEETAGKLVKAVHDPGTTIAEIQRVVSGDLVLACHVFRLMNSPYYGIPGRVASVDDGVRLLGKRRFRLICVVAGSLRRQEKTERSILKGADGIIRHCRATALIARELALAVSPGEKDAAYSAGLLHCTGKLGLLLLEAERAASRKPPGNMDGYHGPAGAEILAGWNIPGGIVNAVRGTPGSASHGRENMDLTGILHIACLLSRELLPDSGSPGRSCAAAQVPTQGELHGMLASVMPAVFAGLRSEGLIPESNREKGGRVS